MEQLCHFRKVAKVNTLSGLVHFTYGEARSGKEMNETGKVIQRKSQGVL